MNITMGPALSASGAVSAVPAASTNMHHAEVPSGWLLTPLGALSSFANGANADRKAYGIGAPFVNVLEVITHTHLRAKDIPGRVLLRESALESFAVRRGDVLFNRTSETQEEVGLSAVYEDDEDIVFGGFVIRGRFVDDTLDPTYAGYGLRAPIVRTQIIAQGQGAIRANIGQANLKRVLVPVPPKPEQRAIAQVLSDADEMLRALEALIAKKRAIKQAAMQQFLTGKIRLPGFSGKWVTAQLGEISSIRNQKVLPSNVDQDRLCVELEHIGQGDGRLIQASEARHSTSPKYRFFAGDVLFGRLRPYLRKFWQAAVDGICSTEIWPLMLETDRAISGFLHAIVQTDRFVDAASASYGTHMPRADWKILRNLEISLPTVSEQVAIATVLSDMDTEIAALERRRDKTLAIKQGMMQQLLTGRVRLVGLGARTTA